VEAVMTVEIAPTVQIKPEPVAEVVEQEQVVIPVVEIVPEKTFERMMPYSILPEPPQVEPEVKEKDLTDEEILTNASLL